MEYPKRIELRDDVGLDRLKMSNISEDAYSYGWNACYDHFMKALNAQSIAENNREELKNYLIQNTLILDNGTVHLRGTIDQFVDGLIKYHKPTPCVDDMQTITNILVQNIESMITLNTPKECREIAQALAEAGLGFKRVMSVEEIAKQIDEFYPQGKYDGYNGKVADAIHAKLTGNK